MKRLFSLLLPFAALALGSCSKVDYTQELENYKDNIFFVSNTLTGESYVSTHGEVAVIGDIAAQTYAVDIKNVQLTEGAPLLSCKVSNLPQIYQPKGESEEDKYLPLYFYFKQETGYAYTSGDLDVTAMKYSYLTGTYWLSFVSDTYYNVWSTPRVRTIYAINNKITSPISTTGILTESALEPGYKFTVDVENAKIDVKAQGVKFPQDGHDVKHTLSFQSMEWKDIPIQFSPSGYSFYVPELIPIINGKAAPEHTITELYGEIAYDYDGKKTVNYKMKNQNGDNIRIESTFGLSKSYK